MPLTYQRLRAPKEDDCILQQPPLNDFAEVLANNQAKLAQQSVSWDGLSIDRLRQQARSELLSLAVEYSGQYRDVIEPVDRDAPIVMSGHQPTLFHPGVWFKNFVLHRQSQICRAIPINLVVDNDLGALRAINVPTGSIAKPKTELVKFDSKQSDRPFENETLYDREFFESFPNRVCDAGRALVNAELLTRLWPDVLQCLPMMRDRPGLAIAAARHRLEQSCGINNLEVPLSSMCKTESFARFAIELFNNASTFRQIYNDVLDEYRRLHRIRSTAHPVPALREQDGWTELPFWIWSDSQPLRHALWVKCSADVIELSDMNKVRLKLDRANAAAQFVQLNASEVCVRTRAILTTMYARMVLSDVFIHGIGGAKYDQLTDEVIERFFGVQPPQLHAVSATIHLPIKHQHVDKADVTALHVQQRGLRFHAESENLDSAPFRQLVSEKRALLKQVRPEMEDKKQWHDQLTATNENLFQLVQPQYDALGDELAMKKEQVKVSQILSSREYSFCLFDESLIERLKSLSG